MKNETYFYNLFLFSLIFSFSINAFCQSVATYNIRFTNYWNEADHGPLPNNPHYSKLVGVNHNSNVVFVQSGSYASLGIENIAEDGVNSIFQNDVTSEMSNGNAEQYIDGNGLSLSTGSIIDINGLQVSELFPFLTLVSMIAPSPDWMIFINSLELRDISDWKPSITVDLYPYDAGTEEGTAYNMSNAPTNPQGFITSLQGITPFNNNKVGTLDIVLQNVLNNEDFDDFKTIKIYPNPIKDKFSIRNSSIDKIESIVLYNVLGKLVQEVTPEIGLSITEMNVENLTRGIYLLKLNMLNGKTSTRKLIIQ